jgi:ubiquinone/menaquinone biosynthesis C-methylase UbiE
MLGVARENIAAAGLGERVRLLCTDAKAVPFASGSFDAVISNSIVHHIAQPREVLAEAVRLTRAGGLLLHRDLLRPHDEPQVAKLVATYAAGATAYQKKLFGDSLRAALSLDEIRGLVATVGYARDTVQKTSDRHWTWSTRRLAE